MSWAAAVAAILLNGTQRTIAFNPHSVSGVLTFAENSLSAALEDNFGTYLRMPYAAEYVLIFGAHHNIEVDLLSESSVNIVSADGFPYVSPLMWGDEREWNRGAHIFNGWNFEVGNFYDVGKYSRIKCFGCSIVDVPKVDEKKISRQVINSRFDYLSSFRGIEPQESTLTEAKVISRNICGTLSLKGRVASMSDSLFGRRGASMRGPSGPSGCGKSEDDRECPGASDPERIPSPDCLNLGGLSRSRFYTDLLVFSILGAGTGLGIFLALWRYVQRKRRPWIWALGGVGCWVALIVGVVLFG